MRSRVAVMVSILALTVAASSTWLGCGDDEDAATFRGNVTSVSPSQAMLDLPSRRWLADVRSLMVSDAIAQSTCPARHVTFCASNGQDDTVCVRVDSDTCEFALLIDTLSNRFANGSLRFVDDVNRNGAADSGESVALLTNSVGSVCNDSVVILTDVTINFTTNTASARVVEKRPDTCQGAGPQPTATPAYSAGMPLNRPPSTTLAFLASVGALGLLLPSRRRSRRG